MQSDQFINRNVEPGCSHTGNASGISDLTSCLHHYKLQKSLASSLVFVIIIVLSFIQRLHCIDLFTFLMCCYIVK